MLHEDERLPYPRLRRGPEHQAPAGRRVDGGLRAPARQGRPPRRHRHLAQDKNIQGTVYPDARWPPATSRPGPPLTQRDSPSIVYSWTNRSASESNGLLTNPDGFQYRDPDGQVSAPPSAYRRYKALMFVLDKRFADRWQGPVSYVLSKAEGSSTTRGSQPSAQSTLFETPDAGPRQQLRPAGLRPHARGEGVRDLPDPEARGGPQRATTATSSAPPTTPYQRFRRGDINYSLVLRAASLCLEPRGNRRLDNQNLLDLRVEKIFKLGQERPPRRLRGHPERVQRRHIDVQKRYPLLVAPACRRHEQ